MYEMIQDHVDSRKIVKPPSREKCLFFGMVPTVEEISIPQLPTGQIAETGEFFENRQAQEAIRQLDWLAVSRLLEPRRISGNLLSERGSRTCHVEDGWLSFS
jgi:hypothetical protein